METKLILFGKLQNISETEFENKKVVTLQFLNTNNGKLELLNVKVDNEHLNEISKIKVGDEVKLFVKISVYNNNIYYKCVGVSK